MVTPGINIPVINKPLVPVPEAQAFGEHGTGVTLPEADENSDAESGAEAAGTESSEENEKNSAEENTAEQAEPKKRTAPPGLHTLNKVNMIRKDLEVMKRQLQELCDKEGSAENAELKAAVTKFEEFTEKLPQLETMLREHQAKADNLGTGLEALETVQPVLEQLPMLMQTLKEQVELIKTAQAAVLGLQDESSRAAMELAYQEFIKDMQAKLMESQNKVEDITDFLRKNEDAMQELATSTGQLATNVGTLSSVVQKVTKGVEALSASVKQEVATVKEDIGLVKTAVASLMEGKPSAEKPADKPADTHAVHPDPKSGEPKVTKVPEQPPVAPSVRKAEAPKHDDHGGHPPPAPAHSSAPASASGQSGTTVNGGVNVGHLVAEAGSQVTLGGAAAGTHTAPDRRSHWFRNILLTVIAAASLVVAYKAATYETRSIRNDGVHKTNTLE